MVEQAIYTWSSHDVNGNKGQGFGAVSPGLADSIAWLNSLDLSCFQPLDADLGDNEARAYDGWKKQVTTGSFQVGDLSFVYRKTASAGRDSFKRNRFVVHVLIGRRDEFDLSVVADADPNWLGAAQCPLDDLPAISSYPIASLRPHPASHDCHLVHPVAMKLLATWLEEPRRLTHPMPPSQSTSTVQCALLTLVPTDLWNSIELDWQVGPEGPIVRMAVAADIPPARTVRSVELEDCLLHQSVDRIWRSMSGRKRTWQEFLQKLNASSLPAEQLNTSEQSNASHQRPAPRNPRHRLFAAVADQTGLEGWRGETSLTDSQAELALRAIKDLQQPPGGWLEVLTPEDLHKLFSGVNVSSTFVRSKDFFDEQDPSLEFLVRTWQSTGLAVVAATLLGRNDLFQLEGESWALPASIDYPQLRSLICYLLRNEARIDQVGLLLNGGLSSSHEGRQATIRAITAANVGPRKLFGEVFARANLPARDLLAFMRENLDLVSEWLHLDDQYQEALRLGLWPSRRELLRIAGPILMHGGEEADGPR